MKVHRDFLLIHRTDSGFKELRHQPRDEAIPSLIQCRLNPEARFLRMYPVGMHLEATERASVVAQRSVRIVVRFCLGQADQKLFGGHFFCSNSADFWVLPELEPK